MSEGLYTCLRRCTDPRLAATFSLAGSALSMKKMRFLKEKTRFFCFFAKKKQGTRPMDNATLRTQGVAAARAMHHKGCMGPEWRTPCSLTCKLEQGVPQVLFVRPPCIFAPPSIPNRYGGGHKGIRGPYKRTAGVAVLHLTKLNFNLIW